MRKFFVRISMVAFIMVSLASCIDDSADIVPSNSEILTTENGHNQSDDCKTAECG